MHAETLPVPTDLAEPRPQGLVARALDAAWRLFTSGALLLFTGLVSFVLVLVALLLPQLPNNLQNNSAAATRWLMAVGAEFGPLGSALRTLGLFNLLHSPVFILLLTFLLFLLSMQLARQIGIALGYRRLGDALHAPPAGREPLALPSTLHLHRRRRAVAEPADNLAANLDAALRARFSRVMQADGAPVDTADDRTDGTSVNTAGSSTGDITAPEAETRLLALRNQWTTWLRPVLVLGLLTAVASLWLNSAFGWEVLPDTLAPGAAYRYPPRSLEIAYLLDEESDTLAAGLHTRLGDTELTIPIEPAAQQPVGRALLLARAQTPGLVVQTQPKTTRLALPGEPPTDGAVGFSFPQAGSEQSLLMPDAAIGVRLVRLAADEEAINPYMIELYQAGQATAVQRELVDVTRVISIEVDGPDVLLQLTPAPAVDALIRYQPLGWLAWVGLVLVVVGFPGYLRRPGFALAQLTPLSATSTQVIMQTDRPDMLDVSAASSPPAADTPAADTSATPGDAP